MIWKGGPETRIKIIETIQNKEQLYKNFNILPLQVIIQKIPQETKDHPARLKKTRRFMSTVHRTRRQHNQHTGHTKTSSYESKSILHRGIKLLLLLTKNIQNPLIMVRQKYRERSLNAVVTSSA